MVVGKEVIALVNQSDIWWSTSPPHSTKPKIYLQHVKSLIFAL